MHQQYGIIAVEETHIIQ